MADVYAYIAACQGAGLIKAHSINTGYGLNLVW